MKISVFGTGYVGLVTGICFAEMGNEVICADIDSEKIRLLNSGVSPIFEPGLDEMIVSNLKEKRIEFVTDIKHAVESSDILFIAVGTPSDEDGSADLKYVINVAENIALYMNAHKTIVTKSTVPVGTFKKVSNAVTKVLQNNKKDLSFDVVSNPEFLREGCAIEDSLRPHRVVVGVENERSENLMKRLYEPFLKNGNPFLSMDPASSEMTKYAANCMLAARISVMNEFSRLCEKVGADIENVRRGIGSDPRIGSQFIYAGVGYGGSCFPKDVRALIHTGSETSEPMNILKNVELTNKIQRQHFFDRIKNKLGSFQGKKISLWGVAFKPDTDDIREAPALDFIQYALENGASINAYDTVAAANTLNWLDSHFPKLKTKIKFFENQYDTLDGSDALVIMTEWKSFREPNFEKIKSKMNKQIIFDGRNIYSLKTMKSLGFSYYSIGRPEVEL